MMELTKEKLKDAVELDFNESKEFWNEYKLEDGTTLKVRLILRGVKRLNTYEPDGTPIYVINSMNVVRAVNVPDEVKKQDYVGPL